MSAKTVGQRVFDQRDSRDLSLRDVAKMVGISASHLCDIENGRRNLTTAVAIRLEDALGCEGSLEPIVECPHCGRAYAREGE